MVARGGRPKCLRIVPLASDQRDALWVGQDVQPILSSKVSLIIFLCTSTSGATLLPLPAFNIATLSFSLSVHRACWLARAYKSTTQCGPKPQIQKPQQIPRRPNLGFIKGIVKCMVVGPIQFVPDHFEAVRTVPQPEDTAADNCSDSVHGLATDWPRRIATRQGKRHLQRMHVQR